MQRRQTCETAKDWQAVPSPFEAAGKGKIKNEIAYKKYRLPADTYRQL